MLDPLDELSRPISARRDRDRESRLGQVDFEQKSSLPGFQSRRWRLVIPRLDDHALRRRRPDLPDPHALELLAGISIAGTVRADRPQGIRTDPMSSPAP